MLAAMSAISASGTGTAASAASNFSSAFAAEQAAPLGDGQGAPAPFSDLLTDSVNQVNQLQDQARTAIDGLMTGTGVDVSTATIAEQKSDMAFELALSVRNKAMQAYQSVMSMQF
ncbi:MAG: flagellar hook-basal body complex protein FliE [Terracidiphilus sp.]